VWIDVAYERNERKTIRREDVLVARPDITLSILKEEDDSKYLLGRFMLDAKYKTFEGATGGDLGGAVEQIKKYQSPKAGGKIEDSLGAFLMHVNEEKEEFDYKAVLRGDKQWRGWIPVLPGDIDPLKWLLKNHLLRWRLPNEL